MKITLVNTDFPSVTPVPPLGVLSLAKMCELSGHRVEVRDYQLADVEGSRDPSVFAEFCRTDAEVLGVSAPGFSLPLVILGLKEVRRLNPDIFIVMGGIGASGAAHEIMEAFSWIDAVVFGEGENTLIELLECVENKRVPEHVKGLFYRSGGRILENPKRPRVTDLQQFGILDFKYIDLDDYKLINVIASRGCPFPCTFCDVAPYWERRHVPRPLDFLVSEIETITCNVHPSPTFVFVDDTLTVSRERTERLCRELGKDGLNVEWACYARASDLDEPLLELMGSSGCRKVYLGLESGSETILKQAKKGFDTETSWRTAYLAKQYIPIVQTAFVWGFPDETWDDFYQTLLMMAYLTSKGVSVKANVLTPLPFSEVFEKQRDSMVFLPEYSPQLHLAEYDLDSDVVALIRRYPRIFPCFFLYDSPTLTKKYDLLRAMKLSPEHEWDLWIEAKGPVPKRVNRRFDGNTHHL
jgi:radical SAM superfamily enzyme YgiQ (UPF0313 family)